jgi:putative membrane protein
MMNDAEIKKNQPATSVVDWLIRLAKGALVGIGAIVPGFSGGVLAVVFGIYEPLMRFLASPFVNFVPNFLYFLPVGIGGVIGVVAFSAVVDFAFSNYAAQFTWLFIGFIAGTFPSLFKTAGKEGRKTWHWLVLAGMAGLTFFYMSWIETIRTVAMPLNIWTWLLSGTLMGLGMVVPGMSPSNFLIYLGIYQAMASGIKQLDPGVILPIMAGVLICILIFAKLISWLFNKAYPLMYHLILGIVVGSTLAIIPRGVSGWAIAVCALLFALGVVSSYALSKLDEKHPHESLF